MPGLDRDASSLTATTPDGTVLHLRRWPRASGAPNVGSAMIVHGLGEHGNRYAHVAAKLNELGYDVFAHDHRGFGKSAGARAVIPARDTLLQDLALVYEKVSGYGGTPALLGHSMGGAIVAHAVTSGLVTPRAMILSSPGLISYASAPMRMFARAAELLTPNLAVPHGLPLDKISHDTAVLAEAAADPLNHALISPRLTNFILDAGEAAIRDAGNVTMPTLIQAAGEDRLVDPQGAREFASRLKDGIGTLIVYPGLWHEIYNEREPDRAKVLGDLTNWLREKLA